MSDWLRLSEVWRRLECVGVGADRRVASLAYAGLRGRIFATGFRSARSSADQHRDTHRTPIRRMMWRVLCSPKADAAGFRRWDMDDGLGWSFAKEGRDLSEAWQCVFVDRVSIEALLAELTSQIRDDRASDTEIAEWIATCPGNSREDAWPDFQRYFGSRACKRDAYREHWEIVRGKRGRGRPRKIAELPDIERQIDESIGFPRPS